MNPGLEIFTRARKLQRGTEEVPKTELVGKVRDKIPPFFVDGKWWWERPPALRPMSEMPENEEDLSPEELRREQEDYKRRVRESKYIQAQMGTSAVNPGLKLFRKQQLKKPKL